MPKAIITHNNYNKMKKGVDFMTEAKRRLRVCLVCIVLLAIVIGMFYYYHGAMADRTISDGTLVINEVLTVADVWQ